MKTSLEHIPLHKQQEILKVVEIITSLGSRKIKAEMVILYGSYARGDFVERDIICEWSHTLEYRSDFDILIITRKPTPELNNTFGYQIWDLILKDRSIRSPVSIIVEDIYHVNARLWESRYFYMDIKNEGIVLFDSKKCILWSARILSSEEKKQMQKDDFENWFGSAERFYEHFKFDQERDYLREWAFHLHQTTEKSITAYLLVKTWYKPKTHDLRVLYTTILNIDPLFGDFFNLDDVHEEYYFELLRKGYVDARYSKTYNITKQETKFIEKRVMLLRKLINRLCKKLMKGPFG